MPVNSTHTVIANRFGNEVYSLGENFVGQLGIGNAEDRNEEDQYIPVKIDIPVNLICISSGRYHTAAVGEDGSLWAWGDNTYGELGDMMIDIRRDGYSNDLKWTVPTKIMNLPPITTIACGDGFTLALDSQRRIWSFGKNSEGRLGTGSNCMRQCPAYITKVPPITMISAGNSHSVVLDENGRMWSFGFNRNGELGLGDVDNRNSPQQIPERNNIVSVSCGFYHTLALDSDGVVWSFGQNGRGQTGPGFDKKLRPTKIEEIAPIIRIWGAGYSSYIEDYQGNILGFGCNRYSQLVIGESLYERVPCHSPRLSNTRIIPGANHVISIDKQGNASFFGLFCDNSNGSGALYKPAENLRINLGKQISTKSAQSRA